MPKKSKKSVSKRMSSKDKFKIVRKVKEHNRKKRKEAKKSGKRGKASLLKDPGIPSNFPFREQVVKEFKFEKDRIAAKDAAKKEARRARRLALQEVRQLCVTSLPGARVRTQVHERILAGRAQILHN